MIVFGHVELRQFCRQEGVSLVFYGYSVSYDREGVEVSRTNPSRVSSMYLTQPIEPLPWWKKLWRCIT